MKKQPVTTVTVMLAAVSLILASSAFAADKETEAVRAAADEFYLALNSMFTGELGPMKRIWSHEDDVTYMGPDGGFRVGWKQVLDDWEKQAALKLGGKVEPKDMRITSGRDLAFVSNYEIGKNVTAEGESRNVTIRATNLFRKEDGNWKMIGHHTDILSFLQK
jgi:ketosteroid isomerase-like protein